MILFLKFDLGSIYALYSRMQGADAVQEALPHKTWENLFQAALDYAQMQVSPLYWRGTLGGVLPHGYDPNSIAAEALLELLKRQPPQPNGQPPAPPPLLPGELRRLVWRHVDRRHHRKENFLTVNEPDLDPVFIDDGPPTRVVELIPSPESSPLETVLEKEADAETARFEAEFSRYLGKERRLQRLFALFRAGVSKPRAIARKLKIRIQAVAGLRKRLQRRLAAFYAAKTSAQIRI